MDPTPELEELIEESPDTTAGRERPVNSHREYGKLSLHLIF